MQSCLYFSRLGRASRWHFRSVSTAVYKSSTAPITLVRQPANKTTKPLSRCNRSFAYSTKSESKGHARQARDPFEQPSSTNVETGEVVSSNEAQTPMTWRRRVRRILTEYRLFPSTFEPNSAGRPESTSKGISPAIEEAFRALSVISRDIDIISKRVRNVSRVIRRYASGVNENSIHPGSPAHSGLISATEFDPGNTSRSKGLALKNAVVSEDVAGRILARWIDLPSDVERVEYWRALKQDVIPSSLPFILLHHLNKPKYSDGSQSELETTFRSVALETLTSHGFTMADVESWAWIVSGFTPDIRAKRFLLTPSSRPTFLLMEILRRDIFRVRILKMLLIYVWDLVLGNSHRNFLNISDNEIDAVISRSEVTDSPSRKPRQASSSVPMLEAAAIRIFKSLLYQTRRIWPPAMVSVAHMIPLYISSVLRSASGHNTALDSPTHARLSNLYNTMLDQLSRPASVNPFISMVYNWDAQRVLLQMASDFEPPLSMNQKSYRAIVQVLASSKKSDRETRVASLRARGWPPWRIEQDGMDAQRSLEDDVSRVVSALARTQEAGYQLSVQDLAIQILGGQEIDGTPTIHTRTLQKPQRHRYTRGNIEAEPEIWAARIQATRDVEEAWSAFDRFREAGGRPDESVYFAILEKLVYEHIRVARRTKHNGVSGDGKELLAPSNENFSASYKLKRHPPPFESLYKDMIRAGIRPSGRFLSVIVAKAATIDDGITYLSDSGQLSTEALAFLRSPRKRKPPPGVLKKLTVQSFTAFLDLLSRFAARVVPRQETFSTDWKASECDEKPPLPAVDSAEKANAPTGDNLKWGVIQLSPHTSEGRRYPSPLLLATQLLSDRRPHFRPAWYTIFEVLARRGTIIDRSTDGIQNDLLAWRVLEALLNDFHRTGVPGLELDPQGFIILCRGAEKAVLASSHQSVSNKYHTLAFQETTASTVLKPEFRKLTEYNKDHYVIPRLYHSITGIHLHAYIRVMGILQDYDEMLYVLRWMVEHHEILDSIASQAANGHHSLRTALIAIRVFCGHTDYSAEAQRLVESVDLWMELWDGWPKDEEAQEYVRVDKSTLYKDAVSFS